ncbi:hypothetical protein IAQ61_004500 [Plenodomus lingam]|uniref:uncharacterized protein n=1 Tax=Leptosphaeria maculans TaxID=5022 RepID=UPI00333248B0|nr:hypothetical protein IAQ61_004500 [Plenodomus lingam]
MPVAQASKMTGRELGYSEAILALQPPFPHFHRPSSVTSNLRQKTGFHDRITWSHRRRTGPKSFPLPSPSSLTQGKLHGLGQVLTTTHSWAVASLSPMSRPSGGLEPTCRPHGALPSPPKSCLGRRLCNHMLNPTTRSSMQRSCVRCQCMLCTCVSWTSNDGS